MFDGIATWVVYSGAVLLVMLILIPVIGFGVVWALNELFPSLAIPVNAATLYAAGLLGVIAGNPSFNKVEE